jgi:RimJ/RimL family protein N-acetyltransferase
MQCVLREVRDEDLPLLFEQWADPIAVRMAAFTAPDQADWHAFERRWSRLRADESVIARAIVVDGEVTGTIGSWGDPDEREVTYWDRPLSLGQGNRYQRPQGLSGCRSIAPAPRTRRLRQRRVASRA